MDERQEADDVEYLRKVLTNEFGPESYVLISFNKLEELWQKDYDALSKSRDDLAGQIDKLRSALNAALCNASEWWVEAEDALDE